MAHTGGADRGQHRGTGCPVSYVAVKHVFGRNFLSFIMDPKKIHIWNVRGLNSRSRQDVVRTLVDSARVDVVCLRETKMPSISPRDVFSMLRADFNQFILLPSIGASGGILVTSGRDVGVTGLTRDDNHSMLVQFSSRNNHPWWLTCVYGP